MDSISWERFREQAMRDQSYLQKKIIHQWLNSIIFPYTVGFSFSIPYHELKLYTTHPGQLIGYKGKNMDVLKELLRETYNNSWEWKIDIVEIQGGDFVKASDELTRV